MASPGLGCKRRTSATSANAITLRRSECNSADVAKARRLPAGDAVGITFVGDYCAAISFIDGPRARIFRTSEWVPLVLEPFGFELLELRLTTEKRLGLP